MIEYDVVYDVEEGEEEDEEDVEDNGAVKSQFKLKMMF